MTGIFVDPAPYLPFLDRRMGRAPGLMPLDPLEWIVTHGDFAPQMAARARLIAERREVVHALAPEGQAAAGELLHRLLGHLAEMPDYDVRERSVRRPDGETVTLDPADPLATSGRLVADDLCLLMPDSASGEYRLVGAILCFPSRWSLAEKMGRLLTAIHDPVPDYDDMLARRVNRVFEALRPERPLWRVNWLVHPVSELHLPKKKSEDTARDVPHDGRFYLRTERQTLVRLPDSGAVAFGIKTSVTPVEALEPEVSGRLAEALRGLHPPSVAYRLGDRLHASALARLDRLASTIAAGASG